MTDPIRSASVVPLRVPVSSDHGTAGVTAPEAAVIPGTTPSDGDYQPAEFDGAAITFSVGPGTDIGVLPPGTNWIFVRFLDAGQPVELAAGAVLVDTAPIATADTVAARLGLTSLTDAQRSILDAAISDAVADVEAYLGRLITPTLHTENGVPLMAGDVRPYLREQPVIKVLSSAEDTTGDWASVRFGGAYTVTYLAGLDAATDPALAPIKRYVTAAAMNAPQVLTMWQQANPAAARVLTSVSVEGQTVGFTPASLGGGGTAGSGAPGALPALSTLSRWKVAGRRVFQRPGVAPNPLDRMGWRAWRTWQ